MKCQKCGYDNKNEAKFCSKCGCPLDFKPKVQSENNSGSSKYIIIALIVIIIILIGAVGYFAMNSGSDDSAADSDTQNINSSDENVDNDDSDESESPKTTSVSSTKTSTKTESTDKEWVSIGSYSGSGTGSEVINVPAGKIMVKYSSFPIKNYADNYLYVTGSNGEFGSLEWNSHSAVKEKSDSFTYTSSSDEEFSIDYYETVSWEVEFFRYQ